MKKQNLKLSLNKIKIASISNLKKIRGGNGATVNGQCEDDFMTFNNLTCVEIQCLSAQEITCTCTTSDQKDTNPPSLNC